MKIHLGAGANAKEGWLNLDAEPSGPGVIRWVAPEPIPVAENSTDLIYSEHFVEHVTVPVLVQVLRECHRVLRPGGGLRISTPNLDTLVNDYVDKRMDRWHCVGWHPASRAELMNVGMRDWGHLYIHDFDSLRDALRQAGFGRIEAKPHGRSVFADLADIETRPDCGDLIVETRKA